MSGKQSTWPKKGKKCQLQCASFTAGCFKKYSKKCENNSKEVHPSKESIDNICSDTPLFLSNALFLLVKHMFRDSLHAARF